MWNYNFSKFLNSITILFYQGVILHHNLCAGLPGKVQSWLADVQPVEGVCLPPVEECNPGSIFYSIDGSCKNLDGNPTAGQAGTPFARILPALFSDDYYQDRLDGDRKPLPLARLVRTTLLPNGFHPMENMNVLFEGFGQFISHDTTRSRVDVSDPELACCTNNAPVDPMPDQCRPLIVPNNDLFYSQFQVTCLPGRRLISTKNLGCPAKPILMINDQSAWLDLSIVYSPDVTVAEQLRAPEGGLLKVKNDAETNHQDFPTVTSGAKNCPLGGITPQPGGKCFLSGDSRVNQNVEILTFDIIFHKFHNFLARALKKVNNFWSNDELYSYARRIAIAAYQHTLTKEYIPLLIGPDMAAFYNLVPGKDGYIDGYDSKLNPQTFHSFAAAASRVSHSTINGAFIYIGAQRQLEQYKLREKLFNNQFLLQRDGFMNIIKALAGDSCDTQDNFFSEEVTEHLFEKAGAKFGNDLPAIDINRGREFGLQGFNAFRVRCGYERLNSMDEFGSVISHIEDVEKLKQLYLKPDDVDLYVGLALERPLTGSTLGPVGSCLVGAQFYQYKFSDSLWYEFESAKFTIDQLNSIRSVTLSEIICSAMPEIKEIQKYSLLIESSQNPIISCSETPKINLELWEVIKQ